MAWQYDANGNLTWVPDTTAPTQPVLTNPNPNRQAINPNAPNQPTGPAGAANAIGGVLPAAPGIPQITTPTVPGVQIPQVQNIDPSASAVPQAQSTAQANPQTQSNPIGAPQGANGTYTVQQITAAADAEVLQAQQNAAQIWAQILPLQQQATQLNTELQQTPDPTKQATLNAITTQLNGLYNNYSAAETTLAQAQDRRATALTTAQKNGIVDPSQADLLQKEADKAVADRDYANTQADVLKNGAQGQRDLVAAQAGYENAQAAALKQTAPAQAAYYQGLAQQATAQADTITKQGGVYVAQAQQIQDLIQPQSDLMKAQAAANNAQSQLDAAQAADIRLRGPAQVGLLQGQTAAQYGAAAQALSTAGQNLLGPVYGLQDRLNAIRQIHDQFFGPGAGMSPDEATKQANQAMEDYFQATLGGTTPYAASVAAANAGLQQFGTQAAMYNQAAQAAASRANAYLGTGANVLSAIMQANVNAPKGSTLAAGAFQDVMNMLMGRVGGQAAFAPPTQPTAPTLPNYLQRFAGGPATAPPPTTISPSGPPVATSPTTAAPNTGAPSVNINVSAPPQSNALPLPEPVGFSGYGTPGGYVGAPNPNIFGGGMEPIPAFAQGGVVTRPTVAMVGERGPEAIVPLQQSLPGVLQQHAPLTRSQAIAHVHQLWGNALAQGSVSSPFAASRGY